MDDLIGPGEAARRLGVSARTVQRWLRTGRLPAVQVGDRLKVPAQALPSRSVHRVSAVSLLSPSTGEAHPVRRLLVANRGELVVRIARTARPMGVVTIALVTDDQRDSWWVRGADSAAHLPTTYLDGPAIIAAARSAGADAIHPGYGFLAERADFAEAVIAAGLTWVGPPPTAMRALGDKAAARRLAMSVGVPVIQGYEGRAQSDAVMRREADRIGYPILVKPSAGGGGKGMHVVRAAVDLRGTLAAARREAMAAFGDDRLILERYLDRPRHVEVQLLFDDHGNGIHLGERDCSLQRRHQKVVEEAPAPGVGPELRDRMGEAARRLAGAAGYVGAGTAEFLLADDGTFTFLEMNARLQVEHPVTEAITGIDLVEAQLRVAAGEPLWLEQSDIRPAGHAIEARLYAEDPWNDFLPAVGRVASVEWPSGPGLRVDPGTGEGDEVGTRYDPLLAKLIAVGPDRSAALARLTDALAVTRTYGVTTNRGFLAWLLREPDVRAGDARTDTIEARWHPEPSLPETVWSNAAAALATGGPAALATGGPAAAIESAGLRPTGAAGFRLNGPRRLGVEIDGERRVVVMRPGTPPMSADASSGAEGTTGDGSASEPLGWASEPLGWTSEPSGDIVLDVDGRAIRARLATPPTVDASLRAAHHGGGTAAAITAPMPGIVAGVHVRAGDTVDAHQVLLVLEAMKMENAVSAPVDGVVDRVLVRPGQAVQRGDVLVELAD